MQRKIGHKLFTEKKKRSLFFFSYWGDIWREGHREWHCKYRQEVTWIYSPKCLTSHPYRKKTRKPPLIKPKETTISILKKLLFRKLRFALLPEISHAQKKLCKVKGWKLALRGCRACSSCSYVSLLCKWVFLLLIKLQNSTNYSEDFQQLWWINHNCSLFLKAVASCFGNNVSYTSCQRIFKTTLHETSLCCLVLNCMGWMQTITQSGIISESNFSQFHQSFYYYFSH